MLADVKFGSLASRRRPAYQKTQGLKQGLHEAPRISRLFLEGCEVSADIYGCLGFTLVSS